MPRLRVATFNIRNGLGWDGLSSWPFRRPTTARTLAALAADVVGLQEVYAFQQRYLERRLPRYRYVGSGRDDGRQGERCTVAVAAHHDVVASRTRWYGPDPDVAGSRLPGARFPRIATTVRIELDDGPAIDVTSTHLDEASADRRRTSASQLAGWLDPAIPQIVLGDLNTDPGSAVIEDLCRLGLRPVEPADTTGTEHRFTGRTDGRRIDHILVSPQLRVVHAEVFTPRLGARLASDHFPVVALLELPPTI